MDEGEFILGKPVGIHRRRYSSGVFREEKQYHDLGKVDRREWDEEGRLCYEGLFIEGNLFQESRIQWPNGKKETRIGAWDGHVVHWTRQ